MINCFILITKQPVLGDNVKRRYMLINCSRDEKDRQTEVPRERSIVSALQSPKVDRDMLTLFRRIGTLTLSAPVSLSTSIFSLLYQNKTSCFVVRI